MIAPVLLLAAAVGLWAWKEGRLQALRYGDVAAVVAALVAVSAFRHGSAGLGIFGLGIAGAWLYHRRNNGTPRAVAPDVEEARRLLELPPRPSAAEVRAAHRRLIARVHPDAGGSAELARRVNAARDVLLDEAGGGAPLGAS